MAWVPVEYDPLTAASTDGLNHGVIHDRAVLRADAASSRATVCPSNRRSVSCCLRTLFVSRLSFRTTEEDLGKLFSQFGELKSVKLVRDVATRATMGYAFVEFADDKSFLRAYHESSSSSFRLDGRLLLVDCQRSGVMKGWIPRRLGGGLSGRKESGQLRFGGRERPFSLPKGTADSNGLSRLPAGARVLRRGADPPPLREILERRQEGEDRLHRRRENSSPPRSRRRREASHSGGGSRHHD